MSAAGSPLVVVHDDGAPDPAQVPDQRTAREVDAQTAATAAERAVEDATAAAETVQESGAPARRTVLVADDHRVFADMLARVLAAEDDLACVGVAYDEVSAVELALDLRPDLVVMDLHFEGADRDGLHATARLTAEDPDCVVVLLTGHASGRLVRRAAAAGASSLMPKGGSLPELLSALRTASRGVLAVHHTLLADLGGDDRRSPTSTPLPELTAREEDVLSMLTVGLDVRTIADQLGISLSTCRGYVKTLLRKLDAHSQLEAVAIARRRGFTAADVH